MDRTIAPCERRGASRGAANNGLRGRGTQSGQLAWRVAKHEPRSFWLGWVAFVVFFTLPAVSGYLLGRGFDALNEGETSTVYRYAGAARLRRAVADGGDPLRGDHVDEVVGPHADVPAGQPAQGPDGQRWAGGRTAGRIGRRGADPLPRRRRGRHLADRRRRRRVGRPRVQRRRRDRPRDGRRPSCGGAAAADDRRRARDALRRQPDQGLPRGGPRSPRATSPGSSAT